MKIFEKLSFYVCYLITAYLAISWFNEGQDLTKTIDEMRRNEKLPLQVKILEPHVTGISFHGFEGDIWWLEGSSLSETDFVHISNESSKQSVTKGTILKVPPKAAAYILKGKIPEEGFTAGYYFNNLKSESE